MKHAELRPDLDSRKLTRRGRYRPSNGQPTRFSYIAEGPDAIGNALAQMYEDPALDPKFTPVRRPKKKKRSPANVRMNMFPLSRH